MHYYYNINTLYALSAYNKTHCPFCGLQCAISLMHSKEGVEIEPRDFPTNKGQICIKGLNAGRLINHPERLKTPLIRPRKDKALRKSSWEEALGFTAKSLSKIRSRWGNDSLFVYGSGSLSNEKAYLLGKFSRVVLGTSSIDYNGRYCMSSASKALEMALGIDRGLPFPIDSIAKTDLLLLVGANPLETMPPLKTHLDELKKKRKKIIVVDPRTTPTAQYADEHLQVKPGSDYILAAGLLWLLFRKNKIDWSFIENYTTGFEEVLNSISSFWPSRVEALTGISQDRLHKTADLFETHPHAIILTGRGCEQQAHGVDNVLSFINLSLALGLVGKPNCGFGTLTGQGNGQGAREMGLKSNQLPGCRNNADPNDRKFIAALWQRDEKELPRPGITVTEALGNLGKQDAVKAMIVFGANPLISSPNHSKLKALFSSLEFLAVCDPFLSETAAVADVVLPSALWVEETATVTNLEGRVLLRPQILSPPPQVKTDLEIIRLLAKQFGFTEGFPSDPQAVFEEIRRATAGAFADYYGITYQRLARGEELFWPCPSLESNGQKELFLSKRFPTEKGKARFHPIFFIPLAEEPDEEYPFFLTTGRTFYHYQTAVQTRRIEKLKEKEPTPIVEIPTAVGQRLGIKTGQYVKVETRRGSGYFKAKLTEQGRIDTLFIPFYPSENAAANALTLSAHDPRSHMPSFKLCAARIQAADDLQQNQSINGKEKIG
ncbi:molybdopterin oxidoreductase family protein [Candidatus Methylacidiphilum infernorum]|uniref:Assimilatory nitrate reductase large subunit n=1 Tax=Methylacidiphilum infernorum (isolate V4) TaxID=481448 RepID=B3DUZ6_METI4|nr:molybdopterin oxidoreductase family protein [Candidatus Methylacidiphilum infernorum]ACD83149.1 Assimilatory nitrate reductase large subunit [Methylacidiphilum infernorum V4]